MDAFELRQIDREGIDIRLLERVLGVGAATTHLGFLERQELIGHHLEAAGLPQLQPFNGIYTDLSTEVNNVLEATAAANLPERDRFKYPGLVKANMPVFGDLYHDPLRRYVGYVKGDEEALRDMNPAWLQLIMGNQLAGLEPWQQLLAGIITHIRSEDLAVSMATTKPGPEYRNDYTNIVGASIRKVINQKVGDYWPPGTPELPGIARSLAGFIAYLRGVAYNNSWELRRLEQRGEDVALYRDQLNHEAVRLSRVVLYTGQRALRFLKYFSGSPLRRAYSKQT